MDCIEKLYFEEGGVKPFFKGAGANVLKGSGGALVLVLYDKLQATIGF